MRPETRNASDNLRSIAQPQSVVVKSSTTLRELAVLMEDVGCSALAVSRHDGSYAVVTERDIVRALAGGSDPDADWAVDVMSVDVLGLDGDATIADAAQLMLDNGIRHVAVTGTEAEPAIVSIRDLLRPFLASLAD